MSRIGNLPINIPENVTVTVDKDNNVAVKGPLGELNQAVKDFLNQGNQIQFMEPQKQILECKDYENLNELSELFGVI